MHRFSNFPAHFCHILYPDGNAAILNAQSGGVHASKHLPSMRSYLKALAEHAQLTNLKSPPAKSGYTKRLYRYVNTRTNVSFFDPSPNDERTEYSNGI